MRGSQTPRIRVVPEGTDHPLWPEVVDFIQRLGVVLDPWQLDVLRTSLLRRDGLWAAFAVAVCCPRQNGKNGILEIRELIGPALLGERLLVHTAHQADTSKEGFRRLEDLIDANEWLSAQVKHIWRTNGHESIEFRNGNRIRFRTRTRSGGRGFSGSPVFFDESMYLAEISMGSILPVISAQPDPQVWYMGSAVDQLVHEEGLVFARVRARALAGRDDRLAYFEWSLDADTPELITDEQAADIASVAATNPALGVRISVPYVHSEREELEPRTYAVERLGVGDWPNPDGGFQVIDRELWKALEDIDSEPLPPVCFALDVSPDRRTASIATAGQRADGRWHIELVERRPGTGGLVKRCQELEQEHQPRAFVIDGKSPAGSLLHELEEASIPLEVVNASEHAKACGNLYDLCEQRQLRHLGQQELTLALRGAVQRPLSEAWAWSRSKSTNDITPLVACTLALYGATTLEGRSVYDTRGALTFT